MASKVICNHCNKEKRGVQTGVCNHCGRFGLSDHDIAKRWFLSLSDEEQLSLKKKYVQPYSRVELIYQYIYRMENLKKIDLSLYPTYEPIAYIGSIEQKMSIETGKYLVVRKDGKIHTETFNGSGFAYNDNAIVVYYLPKLN